MSKEERDPVECTNCKMPGDFVKLTDPVNGKEIHLCHSERCAVEYFARAHPNPRTLSQKQLHNINQILCEMQKANRRVDRWR